MTTVTIGSTDYEVYSDETDADEYFNGSINSATWGAFTSDSKKRGLVSGTRLIDRQVWLGEKEDPEQLTAFPRTGLVDGNGDSLTAAEAQVYVKEASQLLAYDLLEGEELETSATTEDLTKRIKAGSVEIENFRASIDTATRFPLDVMELLRFFMASQTAISGSISSGVDGVSVDVDFGLDV